MFKDNIASVISKSVFLSKNEVLESLETPPDSKFGDYAFPCFALAKKEKKSPKETAKELSEKIKTKGDLLEVKCVGPYVNFFIKPESWSIRVLKESGKKGYGRLNLKEKVMIEYSQPNTHKAFHVGHLRGTSLGESLARILRFSGKKVYQVNYSGDTGAHIAKWLWYYTKHDKSKAPKDLHDLERWIAGVYVKAITHLEKNPDDEEAVNEVLRKLESGEDKKLNEVYDKTRMHSIKAFDKIYNELHANFDDWIFERQVEEEGKKISKKLLDQGIAEENEGALIVDLEDVNLGVWVLLRQDGTALYSAKDLALANYKFDKYHIDESIYVVGAAQSMHLQQLFEVLKRMKFPNWEKCSHLSFAEVRLPSGTMSSRTGKNVLYSDIRKEVSEFAFKEIRKRRKEWSDEKAKKIVDQVVVAALKYDMLAINPNKNIVFDPEKATEFEGETGPYLQYTHARACSILRKAGKKRGKGERLTSEKEQYLVKLLGSFPQTVEKSSRGHSPAHLAKYCMDLAKGFNSFYHGCPVIGSDLEDDRLSLVEAFAKVLRTGLDLLAIDAPEEM